MDTHAIRNCLEEGMKKTNRLIALILFLTMNACGSSSTSMPHHSIGFVGCSLTMDAVRGANDTFWPADKAEYDGGALLLWSNQLISGETGTTSYWEKFQSMLIQYPDIKAIW
jgi:hypothetical protein